MGSSLRISSCSRLRCSCSLLAPSLVALLGALLCTRKNVLTNQGRTVGKFRSHLLQLLMNSNVTMSRFLLSNLCLNKDALMYLNQKCDTKYEQECHTQYENDCNLRYEEVCQGVQKPVQKVRQEQECNTRYEQQCETRYEQSCSTVTERECSYINGREKCWDEPRQKCEQVPRQDCKQIPKQDCRTKSVPYTDYTTVHLKDFRSLTLRKLVWHLTLPWSPGLL